MMNLKPASLAISLLVLMVTLTACSDPAPTSTLTPKATSTSQTVSATWTSTNAARHIGERGTICGPIVDSRYAASSKGSPTFLNFDRAYPNHTMVVVIWGSDRGAFPTNPQSFYKGKDVCATGLIESYQGKPEIIARNGNQLQIQR